MKPYILLIFVLIIGAILIAPAAALQTTSGQFWYHGGLLQNTTKTVFFGAGGGGVYGIFFRSAKSIPTLGAVKLYSKKGDEGYGVDYFEHPLNTTINSSYVPAALKYNGVVVSTGILNWNLGNIYGEFYLAYFSYTWDNVNIPDNVVLYLEYDRSKFDWKFRNMGYASQSAWQNNLIACGFAMNGAPDPFNVDMPYTAEGAEYGHFIDYYDDWAMSYETTRIDSYRSNLYLYRGSSGRFYNSRIRVNETFGGSQHTIYDEWANTNAQSIISHDRDINISVWDPHLNFYAVTFNISSSYVPPVIPGMGDLYIRVYDAAAHSLLNGALVYIDDLQDPMNSEYGSTSSGEYVYHSAFIGRDYNISAAATGYSTAYMNYTVSALPAYVSINLFMGGGGLPVGLGYLTFMVTDSNSVKLDGVTIHLRETGQTTSTSGGYARFNVTAPTFFNYDASKTGYQSQSGNVTSASGLDTLTYLTMLTNAEVGPTPTPGHYDMNTEIGKLVDWIASTILTLGVLIWLTLVFTVIGMFMLALRSLGGGSGTLFQTGLFPKNLFGRGGGRRK